MGNEGFSEVINVPWTDEGMMSSFACQLAWPVPYCGGTPLFQPPISTQDWIILASVQQ
jgi:hypothetical protein